MAAELAPSSGQRPDGFVLALRTPKSAAHNSSRTSTGMVTRDMDRASVGFDKRFESEMMSFCGGSPSDHIAGERQHRSTVTTAPGIADLTSADEIPTEVL